jgi:hypothetical protein
LAYYEALTKKTGFFTGDSVSGLTVMDSLDVGSGLIIDPLEEGSGLLIDSLDEGSGFIQCCS